MNTPKKPTLKKTNKKPQKTSNSSTTTNKRQNSTPKKEALATPSHFQNSAPELKKSLGPFSKKLLIVLFLLLLILFIYLLLPQPTLHSLQQNSVTQQGEMLVEFTQKMNKKSTQAHASLQPPLEGKWLWHNGKTLAFQPAEPLNLNETYRLNLGSEAKNWYGKSLKNDFSFSFLVTGPPEVLFVSPSAFSVPENEKTTQEAPSSPLPVIDLKQPITVLFDQPMNWQAIDPEDLLITEPKVEGTFRFLAQRAFEFTPSKWPAKSTVTLSVPEGLLAQNGLKTEQGFKWQLQTSGQRILKITPAATAPIATNQALEVQFQLPITLDQLRLGENVQLFPSNDFNAAEVEKRDGFFNTEVKYKPNDPLTLVFKPDPKYQPNTDYELIFKAGLAGLEKDTRFKFRTGFELDTSLKTVKQDLSTSSLPKSLPAGFAPSVALKTALKAPLALQLCKLPQEVNPLVPPLPDPAPCKAEPVALNSVPSTLNLGKIYPKETWGNGLYWLKINDAQGKNELHSLLLTDTTLIVKRAGDDVLVWALDRLTQEPVPRLEVRVYGPDGKELGRGVTDGSGIYKRNQPLSPSIYVMGIKQLEGENRWSLASDQWPLELTGNNSAIRRAPEVYLISDRNQIAPGETLNFKGLWRTPTQRGYSLPWWGEIHLKLLNALGEPVFSQVVPLKEKASFDGQMSLPPNLSSGLYQLQAFEGEKALSTLPTWIKVEPLGTALNMYWIKEPNFNTKPVQLSVELKDSTGLPGAAKKGLWTLYEHNAFNPLYTHSLAEGQFEFNAKAQAHFNLQWPDPELLEPNHTYSLELQTLDQELPSSLVYTFDYKSQKYPFELVLDNTVLEENAPLKGRILALEKNQNNPLTLALYTQETHQPVWEREVTMTAESYPFDYNDLILPDLKNGIYELKLLSGSKELSSAKTIYVAKDLNQAISQNLAVFLSHENRPVNSKSKLLLNVPEASLNEPVTVLLSYEQSGLLDYDVVVAEQPLNVIDFNVQPNMSPGVYLSALAIAYQDNAQLAQLKKELRQLYEERDPEEKNPKPMDEATLVALNTKIEALEAQRRQLRSGLPVEINSTQVYLPVEEDRKALKLNLNLQPKEKTQGKYQVDVQVLDEFENPVPASLSLMVRPKLHFFLSPMEYFLSLPPFNVSTHSNLLMDSADPSSPSPSDSSLKNLIQPFSALPYLVFQPLLLTDEMGHLTYELNLPETEVAREVLVFANTQENQWGSARMDLPVTPQLSVTPILPASLAVGDSTELGIEINNPSSQNIESVLILESSSLSFQGESKMALNIGPKERKTFFWPVKVIASEGKKELKITFNGQSTLHPLNIHSTAVSSNETQKIFAWLSFESSKEEGLVREFERGKVYQGRLNLIVPTEVSLKQDQPQSTSSESDPLSIAPLNINLPLPAGLKMRSGLGLLKDSQVLNTAREAAELRGLDVTENPLWFFQKIDFNSSQIELTALNLPAGSYQFDFEVQAVWPGYFKMPTLNWAGQPLMLEEAGSVRVE